MDKQKLQNPEAWKKGYQKSSIQVFQNQKRILILIKHANYIIISIEKASTTITLSNSATCYLLEYEQYQEMLVTIPLLRAIENHLQKNLEKLVVVMCGPVNLSNIGIDTYTDDVSVYQFSEKFLVKRINPPSDWITNLIQYISKQSGERDPQLDEILALDYSILEDGKGSMIVRIPTLEVGVCIKRSNLEEDPNYSEFIKQIDLVEKRTEEVGPFPFVRLESKGVVHFIGGLIQYQIDHETERTKIVPAQWFRLGTECFKLNLDCEKYRLKVGHRLPIKIFEKGYIIESEVFLRAIQSIKKIYVCFGDIKTCTKFFDVTSGSERILIDKDGRIFRVTGSSAKFLAYMISQKETQITTEAYITTSEVSVDKFKKDIEQLCVNGIMKIIDPTIEIPRDLIQFDNLLEETIVSVLNL